jgi:biotin operon repressor
MAADLIKRLDFYAAMVRSGTFTRSALAVAFVLLYQHLNAETGRCDPSIARLAEETGLSERSVKSAVEELRRSGWWQIGQGCGRGYTNSYFPDLEKVKHASPIRPRKGEPPFTIAPPEKVKRSVKKGEARFTRTSNNQESDSHTVDVHRPAARSARARVRDRVEEGANDELFKSNSGAVPRSGPEACAAEDAAFETFWRVFPARDGENPKQPAQIEFDKALKRGADPSAIIHGAANYAHWVEKHMRGTERRFIPQAARWLRDNRWNDFQEILQAPPRRLGMGLFE